VVVLTGNEANRIIVMTKRGHIVPPIWKCNAFSGPKSNSMRIEILLCLKFANKVIYSGDKYIKLLIYSYILLDYYSLLKSLIEHPHEQD